MFNSGSRNANIFSQFGITLSQDKIVYFHISGTIDQTDLFDYLHFTSLGYMKWVPKLLEEIKELLDVNKS